MWILYGNISELGDGGRESEKSYLFFLTALYPGIRLPGDRVTLLGKHFISEVFRAFLTPLENPRERFICTPGRTHNRIRSPR
jgi:hypothetical protein